MKSRKWWIAGGLSAVVLASGLGWAVVSGAVGSLGGKAGGKDGADKAAATLEFLPHEVVQPLSVEIPDSVEFSGPLVAPRTAILRAKAAGTLLALDVAEGHRVHAGQPLGRIDLAELNSRIAERSANLASARVGQTQAERTHASNERLAAQQFISPMALENSLTAREAARAQLGAAAAALETARLGLRDSVLLAPIAGIVAKRHVLPGEKVSPEQQVLTLVDLRSLELAGAVGTHQVGRLTTGLPVRVQAEGLTQAMVGEIARIAPAAEPGTRSIGVTIRIDNPKETLRAGQYAMAKVTLPDDQQRLTVPQTAIGQTAGQDHVWLIDKGILARRAVTLGRRDAREGRVEVLAGLVSGQQVLAARFENLREGAKAKVVAAKSTGTASAPVATSQ